MKEAEKEKHWFKEGKWLEGWKVKPDITINKTEFRKQYFANSNRWKKAFEFFVNNDLDKLKTGRYELDWDNLFVNVDEYMTKDKEDCLFEAHKKYADIQYLVYGEEKIGTTDLNGTKEIIPYNSNKDIAFFSASQNNFRLADPERFFIFFPDDLHCPCVKKEKNSKVRKIVIKVRLD